MYEHVRTCTCLCKVKWYVPVCIPVFIICTYTQIRWSVVAAVVSMCGYCVGCNTKLMTCCCRTARWRASCTRRRGFRSSSVLSTRRWRCASRVTSRVSTRKPGPARSRVRTAVINNVVVVVALCHHTSSDRVTRCACGDVRRLHWY